MYKSCLEGNVHAFSECLVLVAEDVDAYIPSTACDTLGNIGFCFIKGGVEAMNTKSCSMVTGNIVKMLQFAGCQIRVIRDDALLSEEACHNHFFMACSDLCFLFFGICGNSEENGSYVILIHADSVRRIVGNPFHSPSGFTRS